MGVHNRDYMRTGGGGRGLLAAHRLTWWLIGVNLGLWFLYAAAFHWGSQGPHRPLVPSSGLAGFIWEYLVLRPRDAVEGLRVWQPFTAIWIHDPTGIGHVFWNMLLLFFFGRIVETWLGSRRMLHLYLGGGLASTLLLLPFAYLSGQHLAAFGASGAVYAVMVWLALREPRRTIYLFFVIRMPLWALVALFMVGRELLHLAASPAGAASSLGHLAGAAWGWLYFSRLGRRLPASGSSRGPGAWIVELRRRRRARTAAGDRSAEAAVRARVDALLAKIHSEGIAALTEEEKAFLQGASHRYK